MPAVLPKLNPTKMSANIDLGFSMVDICFHGGTPALRERELDEVLVVIELDEDGKDYIRSIDRDPYFLNLRYFRSNGGHETIKDKRVYKSLCDRLGESSVWLKVGYV